MNFIVGILFYLTLRWTLAAVTYIDWLVYGLHPDPTHRAKLLSKTDADR